MKLTVVPSGAAIKSSGVSFSIISVKYFEKTETGIFQYSESQLVQLLGWIQCSKFLSNSATRSLNGIS